MESETTCLKGKERSSEITAINYNLFTTYLAVQNSTSREEKTTRVMITQQGNCHTGQSI